jgi:hypothetical protein
VPVISRFLGISIRIYYRDHAPPHFHARYGAFEVLISIQTLSVLEGRLPPRALRLVLEWAALHRRALGKDWELAQMGAPLLPIPPLE